MKIVYFTHSLVSCWNHGNAHFQRGLLRELQHMGHAVIAAEPADSWSRRNLVADHGEEPIEQFSRAFPYLQSRHYREGPDIVRLLDGADLVIVHEWTEPCVVSAIGRLRQRSRGFLLLFHDTHHRAVSAPDEIARFDLARYDGVLAFGASLAEVYRKQGWGKRVFVLHEAADTALFKPTQEDELGRQGIVWIGNWGDEERTEELDTFLLRPTRDLGLQLDVFGVRYPAAALDRLAAAGIRYRGWMANIDVPREYARAFATVHVPRRPYLEYLPGIPTIRVFEALACGIPLVSAPWDDMEHLFVPGEDFLLAADERSMREALRSVACDAEVRRRLAVSGLARIRAHHTCRHRATELLVIAQSLRAEHQ